MSESTLVKMPHCWKSHVTAHLLFAKWLGKELSLLTQLHKEEFKQTV